MDLNVSKQHGHKLKTFIMALQELHRDLSEAKPLGICKITTLVKVSIDSKNRGLISESGNVNTTSSETPLNVSLRETLF